MEFQFYLLVIVTLHVSGSLSAHNQELLSPITTLVQFLQLADRVLPGSETELPLHTLLYHIAPVVLYSFSLMLLYRFVSFACLASMNFRNLSRCTVIQSPPKSPQKCKSLGFHSETRRCKTPANLTVDGCSVQDQAFGCFHGTHSHTPAVSLIYVIYIQKELILIKFVQGLNLSHRSIAGLESETPITLCHKQHRY